MTAIYFRNYNLYPHKNRSKFGLSLATTLQEHVTVDLGKKSGIFKLNGL